MTRPLCLILPLCFAACVAQSGDQGLCDKASDASCMQEQALSEQQALLQTKGARLSKVEKHAREEPDDNETSLGSDEGAYGDWEEDEEEPVLAEESAWDDDEVAEDWTWQDDEGAEDEVAEDSIGEALIEEEEDEEWKVAEATSDEDAESGSSQSLAETPRGGSGGKGKGKGKG
mmetsp:Transcript_45435/g.79063  ORF Transcript_45435/g.79063 Transcript_45435/m.79063 type:complete len:174 (-) Transcript_45435:140-661(-)